MNPIKVLLIHRESDVYRHLTGWWSYPVDEFEWQAIKVKDGFCLDLNQIDYQPDLIVLDDWIFGQVIHRLAPLAYVVVDSPRSRAQFQRNLEQARQADLVLVDSDDVERFNHSNHPARRFAHAVNEQLFFPREKVFDVAFLCWPTDERRPVQRKCKEICDRRGWSFVGGPFDWQDYALFLSSARVVVHKAHVVNARSWRVFDVMAARGCLLSSHLPTVSGDGIAKDVHYREYTPETLEDELAYLLTDDRWQDIAQAGYQHVMAQHTWRARAPQLRGILAEVFQWTI